MLKIDLSLLIQIANFLLLLFFLNLLLYRPIRRILDRRREEKTSLEETIGDYQGRADKNEKGIEEGVVRARKEGFGERETLKDQAVQEEKSILQQAASSVEEKMERADRELDRQMADVRMNLEAQIAGFSQELAEKILGRSIQ